LDNRHENNSRRTQLMKRITDFVDNFQIAINLAYYPPYHSKYNPIERVWSNIGTVLCLILAKLYSNHGLQRAACQIR